MTIQKIEYFLKKFEGFIPVNKFLIKQLGLHSAVMYSELINRYKYFKQRKTLKRFAGELYFYNTIEDLANSIGLSAHQQRKAIKVLSTNNLIKIKYGQGKVRYFHINEEVNFLTDFSKNDKKF